MSTETTYRPDGTFAMTGDVGMISPTNSKTFTIPSKPNPFSKTIGGTGIWHIEQNRLYTTTTNSTSIATNVVHCYEIIALNEHLFTYRMTGHLQGQIRTETRK
jgi:hypothetical protein